MSTRDRLLEVANTLIQRNGFEGFSYADLARELGIRKASIHHHFPSKVDLGLAYCEQKQAVFQLLDSEIQRQPAGLPQLDIYLNAFADCAHNGEMCGVYAMLSDSNLFTPELKAAVNRLAACELQIISALLQRGKTAGGLNFTAPAPDMAVVVCNAVKGALLLNRGLSDNAYIATINAVRQVFIAPAA